MCLTVKNIINMLNKRNGYKLKKIFSKKKFNITCQKALIQQIYQKNFTMDKKTLQTLKRRKVTRKKQDQQKISQKKIIQIHVKHQSLQIKTPSSPVK